MKALEHQSHYDVLGVAREATQGEIERAYRIAKETFSADNVATYSLFNAEENGEIMRRVELAYRVLVNPGERRHYDAYLTQGEPGVAKKEPPVPMAQQPIAPPGLGQPHQSTDVSYYAQRPANPLAGGPVGNPAPGQGGSQPAMGQPSGVPYGGQQPREAPGHERRRQESRPSSTLGNPQSTLTEPARELNLEATEAIKSYIDGVGEFNGPVLAEVRTLYGIDLEGLALQTKIRKTYLEYMETEEFTMLPAAVYVRGFVKILAKLYHLPEERAVKEYMARYNSMRPSNLY